MKLITLVIMCLLTQAVFAQVKTAKINGYTIEYEIAGSGNKVILLEAGGGGGLADWPIIFETLSKSTKVLRYSRVGNGNSDKPNRLFVVEDYVSHLKDLLDHLGIQKVLYIAHSYGGSVARVFSAKYPDQVEALLLVDPSSEHDVDIVRSIDLEQGNREIAAIKLADIEGGKNYHIVDFWAKFPLPNYPEIADIPLTVIASVKRYESPEHLFHSDKGRALWGELWKNWAEEFPQGKVVLTTNSYHLIPQEEPDLVIREAQEIFNRISVKK